VNVARGTTRRQVLKSLVTGTAGIAFAGSPLAPALAAAGQAAGGPAPRLELGSRLYVVSLPGETNVVVRTGAGGALVVDGASSSQADLLLKAVAALPGSGPVHTLINTHWHPEGTGLNAHVGAAGRPIIAHENTRLWLTTDVEWPWSGRRFARLAKAAQPNKTFYDTGTLDEGVRYGYIPDAAHTDGDLYVFFPQENVLAVGDAVSGAGWPVVDWTTGGWIGGIVGALQRLQTLGDRSTRIVPGRGPVLTPADIKAQYEMYGTIYDRLTQLLNRGRGPSEAVAAKPTAEFDATMGNGDEFVRRSFESLWAYVSPDA